MAAQYSRYNYTETTLSTGSVVSVRLLGLFELDDIPRDIPGQYTYTVNFLSGRDYEAPFDMSVVREKPDVPLEEVEKGSKEYYDWQEYLRYQEGLLHQQKQIQAYANYCNRVAEYIRERCIDEDVEIVSPDDWDKIYQAALNPLVTMEEISAVLRDSF